MSYKLDFFDSFVCSGSACKNTCCSGWDISLDKETYDFYQASHGAFSKYVKKNIGQTDGNCYIKMTEERVCPFLNEEGLCKIYQEYGPEHMGNTCRLFPRACLNIEGRTAFSMLNYSCEEVLKRIFGHEGPVYLIEDGEKENLPFVDKMAEFMSVCMDILQEESIPLGIGMATVLYLYTDAFSGEKKKAGNIEIPNEETISSVLQEFELVQESMSKEDLEHSAWEVISSVVDVFCRIIRQTNLRAKTRVLWNDAVFGLSDAKRKRYVRLLWEKNKNPSEEQFLAKRKLYASYLAKCLYFCKEEDILQILLSSACNYIILSEVLPCIWKEDGKEDYFPLMAELGRIFEHTKVMEKHVYPAIQESIHPDVLTYAFAFMVLF